MEDINVCPICGRHADVASDDTRASAYNVECKVCGRYLVGVTFVLGVNQRTERPADALLVRYLSGYTRTANGSAQIGGDNWRELAQKHKDTPPEEKTRKLLKYLQGKSCSRRGP